MSFLSQMFFDDAGDLNGGVIAYLVSNLSLAFLTIVQVISQNYFDASTFVATYAVISISYSASKAERSKLGKRLALLEERMEMIGQDTE